MSNNSKHINRNEYQNRSNLLIKLLIDINNDDQQDNQLEYLNRFLDIYLIKDNDNLKVKDVYRHSYNSLYALLIDLIHKNSEKCSVLPSKIENLLRKTHQLQHKYTEQDLNYEYYGKLANCLFKLWDHLSLDITRVQQTEILLKSNIEPRIKELQELKQKNETIDANIRKIKKKANSWQKDMITILGIFASIILIVAGDLSFSKNMFESIATTPTKDLIKIFCLSALLFFNSMMIMLHVVDSKGENNTKVLKYGWIATNLILIVLFIINSLL